MSHPLPPLSSDVEFEKLVRDILRRVYNDPGIERFGRKGQAQSGIDGFSPADSSITFQCKLKDTRYSSDPQLREILLREMEEEFKTTEHLDHPLTRFVFASTFKNDRVLQEKADSLSSTTIFEYWGWDTVNEKIWDYAEELIPKYYPWCPIRPISGFKQITAQMVQTARAANDNERNQLAFDYYRINDRAEVVFKVVCNDLDVRNTEVMESVYRRLEVLTSSGTLWLVGDGGSGKTTILYRAALELYERDHDVFILDLEAYVNKTDLQSILSLIKYCSSQEHVVLCIDNPAADEEMLETLLRELPGYTASTHVILAERAHRYHALRKSGVLTYLHGEEESELLYVRNPRRQREDVYNTLFELLKVSESDRKSVSDIVRDERLVYVNATYRILLELKKKRRIDFHFDWDDYRKALTDLPTFSEGYKYIALFYLFGVSTPFSTFSRVCGASESQQLTFLETFRGVLNEPIIVDERRDGSFRKITHLRTKHEIVSEIFFREHPEINKEELLMQWAEHTHFNNALETQALVSIFGVRKNYLAETGLVDFDHLIEFLLKGYIREKVNTSTKLIGTLHLAKFWLLTLRHRKDEAIAVLESFVESSPEDFYCRTELAKAYQQQGNFSKAEIFLEQVLELEPRDVNSRTELAKVYQRQKKLAEAETVLREVLDIRPNDLNSRTELAKIYQRQGKLQLAESILVELLKIEKNNVIARTELAKVYQRQNRLDDGEAVLLEVLDIRPNDLNARTELAKIYHRQGKLDQAEGVLIELLQLEPKDLQARTELAKIYQRQGKLDQAIRRLKEYMEIDPNGLHPRTELAKIYQRQGKLEQAEKLLLESLDIDDKQLHPRTELAKIYQRQGKLEQAEAVLMRLLELESNDLQARTELAKIYQRQGKLEQAEAVLMRLLELESNDLQARTELAKIYQRQGKLEQAEKLLLESLDIDQKQLHPRTELAKIYQRQGKLEQAEAVLMGLLDLDSNNLQARTELAKIYQRQGKLHLASKYAEESLLIDPLNDHAMSELLAVWTRQGEGQKCVGRFTDFISQPRYKFTRYSQAPVFRFFQCCRTFGLKDEARLVFERFQSQLDERNVAYFESVFNG